MTAVYTIKETKTYDIILAAFGMQPQKLNQSKAPFNEFYAQMVSWSTKTVKDFHAVLTELLLFHLVILPTEMMKKMPS